MRRRGREEMERERKRGTGSGRKRVKGGGDLLRVLLGKIDRESESEREIACSPR